MITFPLSKFSFLIFADQSQEYRRASSETDTGVIEYRPLAPNATKTISGTFQDNEFNIRQILYFFEVTLQQGCKPFQITIDDVTYIARLNDKVSNYKPILDGKIYTLPISLQVKEVSGMPFLTIILKDENGIYITSEVSVGGNYFPVAHTFRLPTPTSTSGGYRVSLDEFNISSNYVPSGETTWKPIIPAANIQLVDFTAPSSPPSKLFLQRNSILQTNYIVTGGNKFYQRTESVGIPTKYSCAVETQPGVYRDAIISVFAYDQDTAKKNERVFIPPILSLTSSDDSFILESGGDAQNWLFEDSGIDYDAIVSGYGGAPAYSISFGADEWYSNIDNPGQTQFFLPVGAVKVTKDGTTYNLTTVENTSYTV